MRTALVLAVLALCTSCTLRKAPDHLLSAQWEFTDASAEAGTTGPDPNLDVQGFGATYEFLPFEENGNVAITYLYRDHEFVSVAGNPALKTHSVQVGPRWHFDLEKDFVWWVGPFVGLVLSVDSDDFPGQDYSSSFLVGGDAGVRWLLGDGFGLQASGAWSTAFLRGDNVATPDANLGGPVFAIGVFADF